MKYLVFSDIHGNAEALRGMLKEVQGDCIDGAIFCGDIIGYFNRQECIIEELRNMRNLYMVLGNHDMNYLNSYYDEKARVRYARQYGNSYMKNITEDGLEFLRSQKQMLDLTIKGYQIGVVHGNLEDYLEGRLYPDKEVPQQEQKKYDDYHILFCGHTHYRMYKKINSTVIINPGSLGQPRDDQGFSYCIVDISSQEAEYRSVELDKAKLISDLERNESNTGLTSYLKRKIGT